jgi:HrpA-like RNA helicase
MESIARNQATAAQIQHLEDATKNPLTGQAWPTGHEAIVQERRRMPVYGQYQQILDAYHQSQVIVLSSEQGSGKSTQVPQLLLYDEFMSNLRIACTQPRRRAATELAKRVSEEMGVNLGAEVGYTVQGDRLVDEVKNKETRLVYLTEDILIRQLQSNKKLSEYACVILDEAHERTIDLDLLVALLKTSYLQPATAINAEWLAVSFQRSYLSRVNWCTNTGPGTSLFSGRTITKEER